MVNDALDEIGWSFQAHMVNMELVEKDADLKNYQHFKYFVDMSEKIRLTSGNAYVLDRGAIVTIFSAILTYFFLILQFTDAPTSICQCECNNATM